VLRGEATGTSLNGEFQGLSPGDFVRCAVTGEPIMLPDLRYWSVELQEAYVSPEVSVKRYCQTRRQGAGDLPSDGLSVAASISEARRLKSRSSNIISMGSVR